MVDFDKPGYPTQQSSQVSGYAQAGAFGGQAPSTQYGGLASSIQQRPRPRFSDISANWPWVVVAAVFFWPLSFAAAGAAGRVVPAMLDGDYERAYEQGRTARRLGIIALCLAVGITLLVLAVFVIAGATVRSTANRATTTADRASQPHARVAGDLRLGALNRPWSR